MDWYLVSCQLYFTINLEEIFYFQQEKCRIYAVFSVSQTPNIFRKEKSDVKNPIMIFPSSNKYMQSYQEPYFELFIKFQELLKRPNTLLITTGFSFADNHISQMIIQAILHNKSLAVLVSDYNINQENENWIRLQELMQQNYQIAFLRATMNSDLVDYLGEYYDD